MSAESEEHHIEQEQIKENVDSSGYSDLGYYEETTEGCEGSVQPTAPQTEFLPSEEIVSVVESDPTSISTEQKEADIENYAAPQQHPAQEISREEDNSHPQQPAEAATSITAAREAMSESAHQIIQDINLKRKQDTQLMLEFKEALKMQVEKVCGEVEQQLCGLYDQQTVAIQDKLQVLYTTLDNIGRIEQELQQVRGTLSLLH